MRIAIANDHAGIEMKKQIIEYLKTQGNDVLNFGTDTPESVDYPDYIKKAALAVQSGDASYGIVICGTGIGASITANKFKGVHAALCHDSFTAKMARNHNNANILALGARVLTTGEALTIVKIFFHEQFEKGRHLRRVNKIREIESNNFC